MRWNPRFAFGLVLEKQKNGSDSNPSFGDETILELVVKCQIIFD
jgi:hypothetical protein